MNPRSILLTLSLAATLVAAAGPAHAADPTTADCLAASDASLKSGNEHKLRAERTQLLVCAATSCPADVRKECLRRVDEVNAQIPTIVFAAKDATGADLSAVRVTMDGEVLAERLEGTAISIDPGEHTFTFETAGQAPVTKKLIVQEAQKERREAILFGSPSSAGPGAGGSAPASPPAPPLPPPPPPASEDHGLGAQKVLALVAGGLGVAGLGVGGAFGLVAMSKKNDAQNVCPAACPTQEGVTKWSDAKSAGNLSTIGFVAGGVLLAGGVVLWLTAPGSGEATGPRVGLTPGGVLVKGAW
jgi:hypothetical protein